MYQKVNIITQAFTFFHSYTQVILGSKLVVHSIILILRFSTEFLFVYRCTTVQLCSAKCTVRRRCLIILSCQQKALKMFANFFIRSFWYGSDYLSSPKEFAIFLNNGILIRETYYHFYTGKLEGIRCSAIY